VLQVAPQLGVLGILAKPLNAAGAAPPLRVFIVHHWLPQK